MLGRVLVCAIFCCDLWAQDAGAPVIVDGHEVARVYSPVGSFGAIARAPEIARRIELLAKSRFQGELTLLHIPAQKATAIVAGGAIVMAVTEGDAEAGGVPQDELAQRYADAIRKAIGVYRIRHSWYSLLISSIKGSAALLLFCASVWALWQIMRWLGRRLETSFHRLETARSARGAHLLMWERARVLVVMALKFVVVLVLISEFSFMVSYVLGLFPQTSGISTTLLGYLEHTFGRVGTAIVNYLPSGGLVIIVGLVTHYVLRILKFVADAVESGDLTIQSLHPEMVRPTYQLIRVAVFLFTLVVVFPYLPGGKSEAFKGVSLFLGLLLSLGSSSAVSNVLAGLFLTYMRPFRAGDRVKIADSVGDVVEKTLLVTRLRTIKNVEVVIPNTAILNNPISNYSALARSSGLILNTSVTIGYDAPWRRIHELLIRAALDTDGILADPGPFVLETALNDSYVTYELNGYTNRPNDIQNIYSHLHELIQDTFNDAGVEIMSPSFYALRDGNTVTLPENHRPEGYEAPAFRVKEANTRPEASSAAGGSGQLSR